MNIQPTEAWKKGLCHADDIFEINDAYMLHLPRMIIKCRKNRTLKLDIYIIKNIVFGQTNPVLRGVRTCPTGAATIMVMSSGLSLSTTVIMTCLRLSPSMRASDGKFDQCVVTLNTISDALSPLRVNSRHGISLLRICFQSSQIAWCHMKRILYCNTSDIAYNIITTRRG